MIDRRQLLVGLPGLAAALAVGCRPSASYDGPRIASDPAEIPAKLDALVATMIGAGLPVDELQPGLPRERVLELVSRRRSPLPEELVALYTWRNGVRPGATLTVFRDQDFDSLEAGLDNAWLARTLMLGADVFPFASYEGSSWVLPTRAWAHHPLLERPVISVFEGVDVFFYSFATMLDTVTEWIVRDVWRPDGAVDQEAELEIWRRHNPGIFSP